MLLYTLKFPLNRTELSVLAWLVQSDIAFFCPSVLTEANMLLVGRPLDK